LKKTFFSFDDAFFLSNGDTRARTAILASRDFRTIYRRTV